ncbi:hypothetical protein BRD56_03510 [Thermoplasmatales archaeon SW_10_69_26]|nr:MAG: hypothetical protein BRD56_03510 [Thermoplasmatales archaeon SW_10_69_26]
MRRLLWILALASLVAVAGCLGGTDDDLDAAEAEEQQAGTGHEMTFANETLIDDTRAGGEPVIATTSEGSLLVSAHPGSTHYHPSDETGHVGSEFVTPTSGQSYLWRSTDDGDTWTHIGTPGAGEAGPRGLGLGISDPDFTVDGDRIYRTDLLALASAPVDWSDDDGQTWVQGNPVASEGVVDRQWLASHNGTVYFTANYFAPDPGRHVLASEDGLVWERRGDLPGDCGADFVASPHDGTLYAGCGDGIAVSTDDAQSWEQHTIPGHEGASARMTEPAVDGAGNVWMAIQENETEMSIAGSPDQGETWPWIHDVTDEVRHALNDTEDLTMMWPWISAGSEGRVAASIYASPTPPPSDEGPDDRSWNVVTVAAMDADTATGPAAHGYPVAEDVHRGPVCQSGTFCQVSSLQGEDSGDRRLGDFFETTIGRDGKLFVTYSDTTTKPEDVVAHPGFVKQTGGPSFIAEDSDYRPTQG